MPGCKPVTLTDSTVGSAENIEIGGMFENIENIEILGMFEQKWAAASGKEIFSWPPAFMEQKPAETLDVPLQILTQRLTGPSIANKDKDKDKD